MGNSASSLPYSIGKQATTTKDGWSVHDGSRKSDNAPVTVFCAKKPALQKTALNRRSPHMTQMRCAQHHFQQCKKLRHPHILQVFATLDTDSPPDGAPANNNGKPGTGDLIIVTEPCMPLETWLATNPDPEQIAWGIESIVRALHFLHASANLAHGNLSPESIVVTPAGDVKLWNFSIVTELTNKQLSRHFIEWEGLATPDAYRSPERLEARWDALGLAGIHAMDSYGVSVLMQHFFRHSLPGPLVKAVQRMQTTNLKMRPRLQPLLKCPIFDTPYQKVQLQLEEFMVQPVEQKIGFWQNLTPNMQAGIYPESLSVHKLLPLITSTVDTICQSDSLRSQDLYRREVLATIQPMMYIAKTFLGDSVKTRLGPVVAKLFTINDRAIRGTLLQSITFLTEELDKNTLNQAVFEPACSGFSDSSATLRELTLKATLELVPKLSQPNIEKLSRYLVRLQTDPESGIRTNTVIVFNKIAPHMTEVSRQKMLLPAFIRAMKDPFVPCRLSALKSTLKSKEFFSPVELSSKVLPAVTPHLLDGVRDVRKEAFAVVDDLLFFLRQESERMIDAQPQAPSGQAPMNSSSSHQPRGAAPPPTKAAMAPAPASGGYLSGISSWMSSKQTDNKPQAAAPQQQTAQAAPRAPTAAMSNLAVDLSDGWGDEEVEIKTSVSPASKVNVVFGAPPVADDDFFSGFDNKPAKPIIRKAAAPAPKPAVTKLTVEDDIDDGWDDF